MFLLIFCFLFPFPLFLPAHKPPPTPSARAVWVPAAPCFRVDRVYSHFIFMYVEGEVVPQPMKQKGFMVGYHLSVGPRSIFIWPFEWKAGKKPGVYEYGMTTE